MLLGCTNPKNNKNVTIRTRTCSYSSSINITSYSDTYTIPGRKNQIQPSGTIFSNFSDNVAVLELTKTAVALPHCS